MTNKLSVLGALLALAAVVLPKSAAADAYEPNDSLAVAYGPLETGVPIHATLATESDVDWYWLEADQGDLTVTLSDIPAGTDYDLFLTDGDENIYADSQSRGDTTEVIQVPVTAAGPFWIKVKSYSGSTDAEAYTLTATFFPVIVTPPELSLSLPSDLRAGPGDTVTVPVDFETNVNVEDLTFTLGFDPARATALDVLDTPRTHDIPMDVDLATPGEIRVSLTGFDADHLRPGSGSVASVRFRIADEPGGNLALGFLEAAAADSEGNPLDVTASGSEVVPVRGVSLAAAAADGGVRITWTAETDGGTAGFRVLRAGLGGAEPAPLHEGLLPPSARTYLDRGADPGRPRRYWVEAVGRDGSRERFGPVTVVAPAGPAIAGLPYPNPTREGVRLDLAAPPDPDLRVRVVDLRGRVVARPALSAGAGTVTWDGRLAGGAEAPAGIYFIRLDGDGVPVTRRVVKLAAR
jgi:hypothetical protein